MALIKLSEGISSFSGSIAGTSYSKSRSIPIAFKKVSGTTNNPVTIIFINSVFRGLDSSNLHDLSILGCYKSESLRLISKLKTLTESLNFSFPSSLVNALLPGSFVSNFVFEFSPFLNLFVTSSPLNWYVETIFVFSGNLKNKSNIQTQAVYYPCGVPTLLGGSFQITAASNLSPSILIYPSSSEFITNVRFFRCAFAPQFLLFTNQLTNSAFQKIRLGVSLHSQILINSINYNVFRVSTTLLSGAQRINQQFDAYNSMLDYTFYIYIKNVSILQGDRLQLNASNLRQNIVVSVNFTWNGSGFVAGSSVSTYFKFAQVFQLPDGYFLLSVTSNSNGVFDFRNMFVDNNFASLNPIREFDILFMGVTCGLFSHHTNTLNSQILPGSKILSDFNYNFSTALFL